MDHAVRIAGGPERERKCLSEGFPSGQGEVREPGGSSKKGSFIIKVVLGDAEVFNRLLRG